MAPKRHFNIKLKLEMIKYAEDNSGEATARHYNIDPRLVREWMQQKVRISEDTFELLGI